MKEYVVGFLFTEDKKKVLLIRKNKPEWQRGLLNGIGGKIESFDNSALSAIIREVFEETGLETMPNYWTRLCKITTEDHSTKVDFYYTILRDLVYKQKTKEKLILLPIRNIYRVPCIPNLRWLIPMCFDAQHIFGEMMTKASMKDDTRS